MDTNKEVFTELGKFLYFILIGILGSFTTAWAAIITWDTLIALPQYPKMGWGVAIGFGLLASLLTAHDAHKVLDEDFAAQKKRVWFHAIVVPLSALMMVYIMSFILNGLGW